METIIEIKGIEEKEAQNGRMYHKVKTQHGMMSCFESDVVKSLKQCDLDSMNAKVEVVENDKGFKNIRKFIEAVSETAPIDKTPQVPGEFFKKKESPSGREESSSPSREATMYTSYAKDVFIALSARPEELEPSKLMQASIDLIKQARDAFSS